jgi:hypothetical protein
MRLTAAQVRVIHEHMLAGLTEGDMRGTVKIDGLAHSVGCAPRAALRVIRRFMENTPSDNWAEALEHELAGVCIRSAALGRLTSTAWIKSSASPSRAHRYTLGPPSAPHWISL